MNWTKRLFGVLAILLGAVGLFMCLAGIAGVWTVRNRVDETLEKTFGRVDEVFVKLHNRTQEATGHIQSTQDSVRQLNDRVQRRVAELRDVPQEEAADIDQIERQLYARIQQAKTLIEFMQSTVDLVAQLLEMTESTSTFLQDDTRTTQDLVASLQAGRDEINVAANLVGKLQLDLGEVRANRNVDEVAERIKTISSRIDVSLAKVEGYATAFESGVSKTRTDVKLLGEQIRWKLAVIAVVLMVILLWLAVGQLSLAIHGRGLLRRQ
jgi:chromosome segregation ATPase